MGKYQLDIDDRSISEISMEILKTVPEIAKGVAENINAASEFIHKTLPAAKEFIAAVKKTVPEPMLRVVLTDDQKQKLREGALNLMRRKDGSLMAILKDPTTKQIVSQLPLEAVENINPAILAKAAEMTTQIQLAQISIQMKAVQDTIEEVRQGQISDRMATAYSCQQKMLQAQNINNPELKRQALLQIAFSAEDSRNLLMQSQGININKLREQPQDLIGKVFRGENQEKIDSRINELRDSLEAINMVSLSEAMAYQELGEYNAARRSLEYYAEYINRIYLESDGLVDRLDSMDNLPDNDWTERLSLITKNINALPCMKGESYGRKEIMPEVRETACEELQGQYL